MGNDDSAAASTSVSATSDGHATGNNEPHDTAPSKVVVQDPEAEIDASSTSASMQIEPASNSQSTEANTSESAVEAETDRAVISIEPQATKEMELSAETKKLSESNDSEATTTTKASEYVAMSILPAEDVVPTSVKTEANTPASVTNEELKDETAPQDEFMENEDSAAVSEGVTPLVGPILRGIYEIEGGSVAVWKGKWSMTRHSLEPKSTSDFCYKCAKPNQETFPVAGSYNGWFDIMQLQGPPHKIPENGVKLNFTAESGGDRFTVTGSGKNNLGTFDLNGSLVVNTGVLEVLKIYRPLKARVAPKSNGHVRRKSVGSAVAGVGSAVVAPVKESHKRLSSGKVREAGEPALKKQVEY